MTKRPCSVKDVAVAAAVPGACEVALLLELRDDPLGRALGDADVSSQVSQARRRVAREADHDVRVISEKHPPRHLTRLASEKAWMQAMRIVASNTRYLLLS